MIGRRSWLRLALVLALCGLALAGYGYLSLQRLLQQHAIELRHWQGLALSTRGIGLQALHLSQGDSQLQLQALQLPWRGLSMRAPYLQHWQLQQLTLQLVEAHAAPADAADAPLDLAALLGALALLPAQLQIHQLQLELPCPPGRCALQGDLQLQHSAAAQRQQLTLQLNLNQADGPPLSSQLSLQGEGQTHELQLSLAVAGETQLQLHSRLNLSPQGNQWQGQLEAPELSQAQALQAWLGQWLAQDFAALPQPPGAARLSADWQLDLPPGPVVLAQLAQARGRLRANVALDEAWPVPGLGLLQGHVQLQAQNVEGQWLADTLAAELQLEQPSPQLLAQLPQALRPERLLLQLQASDLLSGLHGDLQGRALPLALRLEGQGHAPFQLQAQLALANAAPWSLQWQQARLQARVPTLALHDLQLDALDLQLHLSGHADPQQLSLQLQPGSQLRLGQLHHADAQLQGLSATGAALQLKLDYPGDGPLAWQLQGPLALSVEALQQPQLKPQRWTLQGQLQATDAEQRLNGTLSNAAGLTLDLQLQHAEARGLQLQARLGELFLRASNPLQQSLTAWPPLLEFGSGRISGHASLRLPPGAGQPSIQAQLQAQGLAGIYDRSELSGLDLRLQLRSDARQLQLSQIELQLAELNPGLPIGPLQFKGHYQAPSAYPDKGLLQIEQASSGLLGGRVQLAPGAVDLADEALLLPLEVQGVELERLFILYPTEGLAGSGILDGQLPLRIDASGATISAGQLSARRPGGQLQLHSERIRALGRSNPAMQLVTQSLEDFRYQVLSTRLDYDQQGKLQLAMRLEGQNPAIEQGRPIHFSINLEEDIPSLLASLQLTDKVSEVIRQRVQQRMLQRQGTSPDNP